MNTQTSLVAEQVRLQQRAEQIEYSCAMKSHFRKSASDYSIDKVYKQQKYMYEHKVHSVPDRIAVERAFALAKQKYGLGLITSRLDKTTRCSIALSVIAMNVDRLCRSLLRLFYDIVFSRYKQHEFMLILIQNNNVENLVCC